MLRSAMSQVVCWTGRRHTSAPANTHRPRSAMKRLPVLLMPHVVFPGTLHTLQFAQSSIGERMLLADVQRGAVKSFGVVYAVGHVPVDCGTEVQVRELPDRGRLVVAARTRFHVAGMRASARGYLLGTVRSFDDEPPSMSEPEPELAAIATRQLIRLAAKAQRLVSAIVRSEASSAGALDRLRERWPQPVADEVAAMELSLWLASTLPGVPDALRLQWLRENQPLVRLKMIVLLLNGLAEARGMTEARGVGTGAAAELGA